jgi:hypothetical protein
MGDNTDEEEKTAFELAAVGHISEKNDKYLEGWMKKRYEMHRITRKTKKRKLSISIVMDKRDTSLGESDDENINSMIGYVYRVRRKSCCCTHCHRKTKR